MQKELIYDSLTFVRGVYACQTNLGVVISRVCEDFLGHGHEGVPQCG